MDGAGPSWAEGAGGAGRGAARWAQTPATTSAATPRAMVSGSRWSRSRPETAPSSRTGREAGPIPGNHAPVATASPATASIATAVAHTMSTTDPRPSREEPLPVTTNAIGARNAGRAYLGACHIVGIVRPPVIAL